MGNFIIDTRIKKLERIKQNLLTLKKNQRGDELTQVNGMINRLKKWNLELEKAKDAKVPKKTSPYGNYKPGFDFYKDRIESNVPEIIVGMRIHEDELRSTNDSVDAMEMAIHFLSNKKDCHQDENTDTFCALMRKVKKKKQ